MDAPYRFCRRYAALSSYRRLGLPDTQWAGQQFSVRVHVAGSGDLQFQERCARIWESLQQLPLQLKDVLRGVIDEIRIERQEAFASATLGTWRAGVIRLNGDWSLIPALKRAGSEPDVAYRLLRSTLVHECGHALVEDSRGGVPLRQVVRLLASSGWLPHPAYDPIPYGAVGDDLDRLTTYYLQRLHQLDPRWRPDRPLNAPGSPSSRQLDRDLMARTSLTAAAQRSRRSTLGLVGPNQLATELRSDARQGREWPGVNLERAEAVISRRFPVSPYAEEAVAETPAEIFRVLYTPLSTVSRTVPALEEGRRILIAPWLAAERQAGIRLLPRDPWRGPVQMLSETARRMALER